MSRLPYSRRSDIGVCDLGCASFYTDIPPFLDGDVFFFIEAASFLRGFLCFSGVSIQMRRSSYAKDLTGLACVATMALCDVRRAVRVDLAPPALALGWLRDRERTSGA